MYAMRLNEICKHAEENSELISIVPVTEDDCHILFKSPFQDFKVPSDVEGHPVSIFNRYTLSSLPHHWYCIYTISKSNLQKVKNGISEFMYKSAVNALAESII